MDLTKLQIKSDRHDRPIDPMEIFKSLTLRGKIENIWGPQEEALRGWHKNRQHEDITIEINTGGGKTLVGLIVGLSLVNETQGKVVYVCANKQLVEQTKKQAIDCGIPVATYMSSKWKNESVYDSCKGPCITNYAAIFNSKNIFSRNFELKGIIFDDAHVAYNAIRSQFTLRISIDNPCYKPIAELFRAYFARSSMSQQLSEAIEGDTRVLLYVPQFELLRHGREIRDMLFKNGVTKSPETMFPWHYIKDKINCCVLLISGRGIEISPPILPVTELPYFQNDLRRVYLTATLPSTAELVKTFGIVNSFNIAPGGKSGEAQRLFVFAEGQSDEEQRKAAKSLIKEKKACIIVPSHDCANSWTDVGEKFDGDAGHAAIELFAKSEDNKKLILVARYDGIDLPGHACKVLVLSGLPQGFYLFNRFMEQSLKVESLRYRDMATRVVQAMGRIFRSNTDHGVVILCGVELQRWLRDPNHTKYMPKLLQKQIKLGFALKSKIDNEETTYDELIKALLSGRSDWDKLYSSHINGIGEARAGTEDQWYAECVKLEREAYLYLWQGNFPKAAETYALAKGKTYEHDTRLGAWLTHWEGASLDLGGDHENAKRNYWNAANERAELGRPKEREGKLVGTGVTTVSEQALAITKIFESSPDRCQKKIRTLYENLIYVSQTNPTEEALRELGELLGLKATRPNKTHGTGPDVLWLSPDNKVGIGMEAKTGKNSSSKYTKEEIGQVHDHIQWQRDKYPQHKFMNVIVGRELLVVSEANPPQDLRIIEVGQFQELLNRLGDAISFVEDAKQNESIEIAVEKAVRHFGLRCTSCVESLPHVLAVDMRNPETLSDQVA